MDHNETRLPLLSLSVALPLSLSLTDSLCLSNWLSRLFLSLSPPSRLYPSHFSTHSLSSDAPHSLFLSLSLSELTVSLSRRLILCKAAVWLYVMLSGWEHTQKHTLSNMKSRITSEKNESHIPKHDFTHEKVLFFKCIRPLISLRFYKVVKSCGYSPVGLSSTALPAFSLSFTVSPSITHES